MHETFESCTGFIIVVSSPHTTTLEDLPFLYYYNVYTHFINYKIMRYNLVTIIGVFSLDVRIGREI